MIKSIVVFLFGILAISCNSETSATGKLPANEQNQVNATPAEAPDFTVTVDGFNSGTGYLIGLVNEQQFRVDTSIIQPDGKMHFKNSSPYQEGLAFLVLPDQNYIQILLGKDQTFTMSTAKGNLVKGMTVSDCLDNELLYENLKFEAAYNPKINVLNNRMKSLLPADPNYSRTEMEREALIQSRKDHLQELFTKGPNTLFTAFKRAGQNPDLIDVRKPNGQIDSTKQLYIYRSQFWDNVDFNNNTLLYTPVISNKLKRYITELTPQIADSINHASTMLIDQVLDHDEYYKYFVNWITLNYEPGKTNLMDGEAVYTHMVTDYFTYDRAFWSDSFEVYALRRRAQEMSLSLVGQKGQNVTATDINGQTKSIYDLTSPYVIVYLYNPTCEHCIEETPKLVQFHKTWKSKGLSIYAIAVDTEEDSWRKFVKENGMQDFVNVFDVTNKSIYGKYFVDNTPEVYVLNKDRTIIGKNLDIHQAAEVIERDRNKSSH